MWPNLYIDMVAVVFQVAGVGVVLIKVCFPYFSMSMYWVYCLLFTCTGCYLRVHALCLPFRLFAQLTLGFNLYFTSLDVFVLTLTQKSLQFMQLQKKLWRFKKKLISKMNKNGLKKPQNVFKNKYVASIAFINHLMTTHGEMQWSIEVK